MNTQVPPVPLKGAKALVVGIANEHSIAYGCAKGLGLRERERPTGG